MSVFRRSLDSTRRRAKYATFRLAYIGWRTLWHDGALWHAALAAMLGLFGVIAIGYSAPWHGLPWWASVAPLAIALVYAVVRTVLTWRRVARSYLWLRREMQRQRALDLLGGGVVRRRWQRTQSLRVALPFWAVMSAGMLVGIAISRGPRDARAIGVAIITAAVALPVLGWATRWAERHRPRDVHGLCPRCGYDLQGTPVRCPECGLLPPDGARYWPRRNRQPPQLQRPRGGRRRGKRG